MLPYVKTYLNLVIKHIVYIMYNVHAIKYIQLQNVFSALELILIILKRQTTVGSALFTEM